MGFEEIPALWVGDIAVVAHNIGERGAVLGDIDRGRGVVTRHGDEHLREAVGPESPTPCRCERCVAEGPGGRGSLSEPPATVTPV